MAAKNVAFSVGSNRDKGTSNGIHEECKEFGRMFREKLQEFAMILIKKYHYNFSVEYFDDYHGSFNKEDFLEMEQPKEKSRLWKSESVLTSNVEWKKDDTGFSRTIEEECNVSDELGGEWHCSKGIHDEQIDGAAKAKGQSEIVEREVHIEGNSSKHKEEGVAELFSCNQEIPTETSAKIKEVGVVNEANKSMETQNSKDERRLDEEIGIDHTLQEQEVDPGDAQPNLDVGHVREEGCD